MHSTLGSTHKGKVRQLETLADTQAQQEKIG